MKLCYLICLLLFPMLCSAAGEIHKWRDKEGQVHFGDRPSSDEETELITVKPNVYTSPSFESLNEGFEIQQTVVLYSAAWCGYCKSAKRYFAKKGIPYKEYDVETTEKGRRDYKKLKAHGIPVILVGRKRMNGFSETSFEKLYSGT